MPCKEVNIKEQAIFLKKKALEVAEIGNKCAKKMAEYEDIRTKAGS
jgi:NAD-dependent DNA ligase